MEINRGRIDRLWGLVSGPRLHSRWQKAHRLDGWFCREDEVGGYKARKYASLIPALKSHARVRLLGSSQSNNLLQLALRLRQEGIQPVYIQEGRPGPLRGNGLLSRVVLGDGYGLNALACVPEGASCPESLPGALTIAASLAENIANHGEPTCIFIEAGSGFSAAALILGMAYLGLEIPVKVVWLGDATGDFARVLAQWRPVVDGLLGEPLCEPAWEVVRPPTARSFGAVNRKVLDEVVRLAQEEGLLVDPIYTAKLTLTARTYPAPPASLIYCGGGPFELCGFQEQLGRRVQEFIEP